MRGITEGRLREIWDHFWVKNILVVDLGESIMEECKELTPWQEIDENTRKNRDLHLFNRSIGQWIGFSNEPVGSRWATHWRELPKDPE